MRALVLGVGAVGTRLARQLVSSADVEQVLLRDERTSRVESVVASLGERAVVDHDPYEAPADVDVVVLAGPAGGHRRQAEVFLRRGQPVVSVADAVADVRGLLDLDAEARERGVAVVVGAGFSPGLSCVLARHAAVALRRRRRDPRGPRRHRRAGLRPPAPPGARRGRPRLARRRLAAAARGLGPRAVLVPRSHRRAGLLPGRPARRPAPRARLPAACSGSRPGCGPPAGTASRPGCRCCWPTHPEGGPGALRVEVRGRRGNSRDVAVLGAMDRPAVAAGAVAAVAARAAAAGDCAARVRPASPSWSSPCPSSPSCAGGACAPPCSKGRPPRPCDAAVSSRRDPLDPGPLGSDQHGEVLRRVPRTHRAALGRTD